MSSLAEVEMSSTGDEPSMSRSDQIHAVQRSTDGDASRISINRGHWPQGSDE